MPKDKNQPPPIQHHLSSEEFANLQDRVQKSELPEQDKKLILGVLAFSKWMHERLGRAKLSIKRLRQLFGFKNESREKKSSTDDQDHTSSSDGDQADNADKTSADTNSDATAPVDSGASDASQNFNATLIPNWNENANHGRLGVDAYPGCGTLTVPIEDALLLSGYCPQCATCDTQARVYPVKPTVLIFLEGQPLITGQRVALEKVRCGVCQTYFTGARWSLSGAESILKLRSLVTSGDFDDY